MMKLGKNTVIMLTYLFLGLGAPATSKELRALVCPPGRSKNWGNSYFLCGERGNGVRCSLVRRGLVEVVGKRGNANLYQLTHAGSTAVVAHLLSH